MHITYSGDGKTIYLTPSELRHKVNPTFQSTLKDKTITVRYNNDRP